MADQSKPDPSGNKNISIIGDVKDSAVFIGDNNTVNQTIIQKFFNIFKSDAETLEHRNRRILLGHVENAWIKGVLDASLHGAALLDLGIKPDPEAVTKYPWAIQKESTKETIPAGTSMLEIFDNIGMGRSLLILGAPGSGKTTMLLELARGLIARAREDITQPIPMVFNLASWTEKLTLADWLAQELNNLYSVPRKTAPDWVKGNKLLLLLDGLDEVRQESRAKCVEAINSFRKEHGLTSLAVCSRSQDYADLNAKLSFEGAIEVQPLTQKQITEFFNRFGKEMAGIKQVLKKDNALREMAETPLFLSIMILAYRDKQDVEILVSGDEKARRKHLFDTYIERMFERRLENPPFPKKEILHWLSWLAQRMSEHNQVPYLIENMQPYWLDKKKQRIYILGSVLISTLFIAIVSGVGGWLVNGLARGVILGLVGGLLYGIAGGFSEIEMIGTLIWDLKKGRTGLIVGLVIGFFVALITSFFAGWINGLGFGIFIVLDILLLSGITQKPINKMIYPGQNISFSIRNSFIAFIIIGLIIELAVGLIFLISGKLFVGLHVGPISGLSGGFIIGGYSVIRHYFLRFTLARNNLLPWRLVPFLDHCVDLIFLRRVGGGYIFVHRLLMEHFAEMYVETPTSKGN